MISVPEAGAAKSAPATDKAGRKIRELITTVEFG
jgi:hypothetical protein